MSKLQHLPKEWAVGCLASVANVIDPHPSHRAPIEDVHGIPFGGIGDLDEYGNLRESKVRRVPEAIYDEHKSRYQITSNTIGFGRVASIGKIIDFKGFANKVTISPTLAIVEPNPNSVEKKFLVNALRSLETQAQIALLLTGSTRSSLGIALLRELILPFPPLPEQKKIAAILNSVDDVIEKTQAQIDKLKDLKAGMMQELLTRGVGVDGKPHTEFKDSTVGRIPKAWEVLPIANIVDRVIDCEHKTAPYVEKSEFMVVRTSNVRNGELLFEDMKFTHSEGYSEWTKRAVPSVGDVLFTREAPAGESCLVPEGLNICMGQRMVLLRPNREVVHPCFFSMFLTSDAASRTIYELSIGTTVSRINIEDIKRIPCVIPPLDEQLKISKSIQSVQRVLDKKQRKLLSLQNNKKALMQDLLTGKVRVKVED
ncbi:restriction endonuclease subunit S [Vibrio sp. PNB22_4_1]